MKKYLSVLLAVIMCLCLIACGDKNENASSTDGTTSQDGTTGGDGSLSGKTVWLPSCATYVGSDGTRYDLQTIEMEGTVAKIRYYGYYNGKTFVSSGYDVDLNQTTPFDFIMVRYSAYDNTFKNGLRRFIVSEDGMNITEEYSYTVSDGVDSVTNTIITYDSEDRIEKVIIKDKYNDQPETVEERIYQYNDSGYTISYIDDGWSQTDDDGTKVLRHMCYEIPYEGGDITLTETYRKLDGSVHYPDDFHTNSDQKVDKLVYKVNRQGFCISNTLYLKNGHTETNQDFFMNRCFSTEFNDNGMPTRFVTTSTDGTSPHTSTYTYDDNGNLTVYHEESDRVNFTVELQWKEYPAELAQLFANMVNNSNFAISEIIEDNCPEKLVGPQELIYKKSDFLK